MSDRDLKFSVISTIISFISLGLIIGTFLLENVKTKNTIIIVAFSILIIQKLTELALIKKTRKISFVVLVVLVCALGYFITKQF